MEMLTVIKFQLSGQIWNQFITEGLGCGAVICGIALSVDTKYDKPERK
jgi:hypothetical protein